MSCILTRFGQGTVVLLTLSIILFAGFLLTRITKLIRFPKVSGYIVAGILIGPHLLNIIPQGLVDRMSFVSDIALAFIAFGVGQYFERKTIRETGFAVVIITLFESLLAGFAVVAAMRLIFHLDWELGWLLGAIGTATAPASTIMTIRQYGAKGEFVNILLQVVALDDVVCLLFFSVVAAAVDARVEGVFSAGDVLWPIAFNLAAIAVGVVLAFVMDKLLGPKRSPENRLIIVIAMLLGLSGLCSIVDVSPLLACMVFSAVYTNIADGGDEEYAQLNDFTPPIMLIFFVVSGMNLDLHVLVSFGMVGVVYFFVRILGKYAGAYLGCRAAGTDRPIRVHLGAALVPQAGVAIGLAFLAQRILPEDIGGLLMTIVLASSVLYELIGPVCAKIALIRSGAIPKEAREAPPAPVEEQP